MGAADAREAPLPLQPTFCFFFFHPNLTMTCNPAAHRLSSHVSFPLAPTGRHPPGAVPVHLLPLERTNPTAPGGRAPASRCLSRRWRLGWAALHHVGVRGPPPSGRKDGVLSPEKWPRVTRRRCIYSSGTPNPAHRITEHPRYDERQPPTRSPLARASRRIGGLGAGGPTRRASPWYHRFDGAGVTHRHQPTTAGGMADRPVPPPRPPSHFPTLGGMA